MFSSLLSAAVEKIKDDHYRYISTLTPPNDTAAIETYIKVGFEKGSQFLWLDLVSE